MDERTVLITGSSSGIGRQSVIYFHEQGWNVIATMRSTEKETELNTLDNVLVTRLDVTDPDSIDAAITEGIEQFGSIDALVNNAGYSEHGVFEQWDTTEIDTIFNTNIFGVIRVTQAVLPIMRRQGEGAIINISSVAGIVAKPLSSIYCATKFAVEGLSEALAIEYAPFNIKVHVVAPGAYLTNLIWSQRKQLLHNGDEQIRDYSLKLNERMEEVIRQLRDDGDYESDPQEVANIIYRCATEEMPVHNVSGKDAEALIEAKKTLSEKQLMDKIAYHFIPSV